MSGEIVVDVYEPNQIKTGLGDMATIASLKDTDGGGDYFWVDIDGKTYGIERKEASDFCTSLTHGRLSEQIRKLVNVYDVPILLTEGNFNSNHDGLVNVPAKNGHLISKNIPYHTIMDAIFECQRAGVFWMHTNNIQATVREIKGRYEWSMKPSHELLATRTRMNTITGRADDPVWLLMGLPGIGLTLAKSLIGMFGSPYLVFQAFAQPTMHQYIKAIRGISDAKIDQVREVLLPNVNPGGSLQRRD